MTATSYLNATAQLTSDQADCEQAMMAEEATTQPVLPVPVPVYHLPEVPYSPIDALNRRAAAMGSPGYTMACSGANYNGHTVSVTWNDYRKYYITQYYYGERVVLVRGTFRACLNAALEYWRRGHKGACASICPREDDTEAEGICRSTPELVAGRLNDADRSWYTWRHQWAARSVRDYANPNALRTHFDWDLMQTATTEEEYEKALTAKHGRTHTF